MNYEIATKGTQYYLSAILVMTIEDCFGALPLAMAEIRSKYVCN